MILEPICLKRNCKYYIGISQPDGIEKTEIPICEAYPKGIPDEIAYGDNLHTEPLEEQDNDIVFEKENKQK